MDGRNAELIYIVKVFGVLHAATFTFGSLGMIVSLIYVLLYMEV